MIMNMTDEEALVKVHRSCSVAAAALDCTDLTPSARDGLWDLLEDAVVLLDRVKVSLDASVLITVLKQAA